VLKYQIIVVKADIEPAVFLCICIPFQSPSWSTEIPYKKTIDKRFIHNNNNVLNLRISNTFENDKVLEIEKINTITEINITKRLKVKLGSLDHKRETAQKTINTTKDQLKRTVFRVDTLCFKHKYNPINKNRITANCRTGSALPSNSAINSFM